MRVANIVLNSEVDSSSNLPDYAKLACVVCDVLGDVINLLFLSTQRALYYKFKLAQTFLPLQ